ncbi:sulfide/dihydroorotate dehydrogenase-like FAD/NAD-binding protein [candidate division NPL-UPA2 bacterium]|nr:sulfide/dihydroorotate dehydrogenase-like FAD/NAD-binding protein [candidate division NPL-UPA2 bacterium]
MYRIQASRELAPAIWEMDILAPEIAERALPGQFIILRIDEKGERIPLTIHDVGRKKGTVGIIFQEVGRTTRRLAALPVGGLLRDFLGPLGRSSEIERFGRVICVGGGVGTAVLYPEAKALREAGNRIISIVGARNKELLILEKKMREISHEFYITTDDGSYGRRGVVTGVLKEILDKNKVDLVVTIGPTMMMKFVCQLTREYGVRTTVSLNPIMVDGTGMCGSCRVRVGEETKFVCVDGPEFDGHQVDFKELTERNSRFLKEEKVAPGKHKCCQ